jgi:hypothetical protein
MALAMPAFDIIPVTSESIGGRSAPILTIVPNDPLPPNPSDEGMLDFSDENQSQLIPSRMVAF